MIHLRGWFFQLPEPDNGFPHNNQKFLLIERDHTHEDARYDSYARYAGLIGYQMMHMQNLRKDKIITVVINAYWNLIVR